MSFQGRVAVVTGGASGIGRAVAGALHAEGAETWVLDNDEAGLEILAKEGLLRPLRSDFAAERGEDIAERLLSESRCPDVIVNNVGVMTPRDALSVTQEEWARVLDTNLTAPFFFSQRLIRQLLDEGRDGALVMISSLHARRVRGAPHYSASKAGLEIAALELAHDLAARGIRVNIVRPGWIATSMGDVDSTDGELAEGVIPLGRRGTPADVVGMTLALLDPEISSYITGAVVKIDGGLDLFSWC